MSDFRRRLMMAAASANADGEVTYIESTGQQWIDTGIPASPDVIYEVDLMFTKLPSDNPQAVMGANYDNASSPKVQIVIFPATAANAGWSIRPLVIGISAPAMAVGTMPTINTLYSFRWNNTVFPYAGDSVYIFARANNYESNLPYDGMRLLGCRIYTTSGTVLREYVPWVKNGRACLYEAVNDTYVYSETGIDFIAGARVPYDARVDYLMGDGKAYINTGIKPYLNYGWDVRFKYGNIATQYANSPNLMGGEIDWQNNMWGHVWNASSNWCAGVSGANYKGATRALSNYNSSWHTIECVRGEMYIDSSDKLFDGLTLATNQSTINAIVFAVAGPNGTPWWDSDRGTQKYISDYVIADYNGLIKQRCRSVRVGNVGYMYDVVTGNLLGTASSTPFTVGPDKS